MSLTGKWLTVRDIIMRKSTIVARILLNKNKIYWKRVLSQLEIHQVAKFQSRSPRHSRNMVISAHKVARDLMIKVRVCSQDGYVYVQRIE